MLLFQWNLVCRGIDLEKININHLSWEKDSLVVLFTHGKRGGNSLFDDMCVYSNVWMLFSYMDIAYIYYQWYCNTNFCQKIATINFR